MRPVARVFDDIELLIYDLLVASSGYHGGSAIVSTYVKLFFKMVSHKNGNVSNEDLHILSTLLKNGNLTDELLILYVASLRRLVLLNEKLDYIDNIKELYQFILTIIDEFRPDRSYLEDADIMLIISMDTIHEIMDKYPSSFEAGFISPEIEELMQEYQKKEDFHKILRKLTGLSGSQADQTQAIIEERYPLDTPTEERELIERLFVLCKEKKWQELIISYLFLSKKINNEYIMEDFSNSILLALIDGEVLSDVDNVFSVLRGMFLDEKGRDDKSLQAIVSIILLSLPVSRERLIFFIQEILQEFYNKEKESGEHLKKVKYLLGDQKVDNYYYYYGRKLIDLVLTAIEKKSQTLDGLTQHHGSLIQVLSRTVFENVLEKKDNFGKQWSALYEKIRAHYDPAWMVNIVLLHHLERIACIISLLGEKDFFYYMNRVEYLQFFDNPTSPLFLEDDDMFFQNIAEDPVLAHWRYISEAPKEFKNSLIRLNQEDFSFIQNYISMVEMFNERKASENMQWVAFAEKNECCIRSLFEIFGPKAIDFILFFMNESTENMEKSFNDFYISRYSSSRDFFSDEVFLVIKEVFYEKKYQTLTSEEMAQWHEICKYSKLLSNYYFPKEKTTELLQKIKPFFQENLAEVLKLLKDFPLDFFSSHYIVFHVKREFISLYEKFDLINASHENVFQKRDTIKFFMDHNEKIVRLVDMMGSAALKWLSDQLAKTVLSLERLLNELPRLPEAMHDFLKHYFLMHKDEVLTKDQLEVCKSIIIGVKAAYDYALLLKPESQRCSASFDFEAFFSSYKTHEGLSIKDFSVFCRKALFDAVIKTIGISEEEAKKINSDILFSILSPIQFAQLGAAKLQISTTDHGKILHELINCYLKGASIYDFLHNDQQAASSLGRGLAAHNMRIQRTLSERGIKTKEALSYSKTYEFTLEPKSFHVEMKKIRAMEYLCGFLNKLCKADNEEKNSINQINAIIKLLQEKRNGVVTSLKETPDSKTLIQEREKIEDAINTLRKIQKNYKQIFKDKKTPMELYKDTHWSMFETIHTSLKVVVDSGVVDKLPETKSFFEFAEHYQEAYASAVVEKAIVMQKTDQLALQHFRVEQWDKEKITTLFLGNEVGCCLAVGNSQFSAIVQRIMDDAMQFHVVVDMGTQKPIALTWLYFGEDSDKNTYLVANFIEINMKYSLNDYARETIVNALLHFSGELYCNDVGIHKYIINKLTYGYNAGKLGYFDQEVVRLRDKVGGAFSPQITHTSYATSDSEKQELTCNRYYLASLQRAVYGSDPCFHVYRPEALTAEKRAAFASIEERAEKISREQFLAYKLKHADLPNDTVFDAVIPEIRKTVIATAGVFFDNDINSQRLTVLLERSRKVVLEAEESKTTKAPAVESSPGTARDALFAAKPLKTSDFVAPESKPNAST
ncbi:MAG: hypothetical protein A3E88_01700 [Legionellales bacterium RIFCSPHIGHO2_12_FULL_35_11]|nr:MAG: hypothetical protein A3E88_01700 [Legionellales bacterium RIFCSPHIGHO2_12_FULL_35_11]